MTHAKMISLILSAFLVVSSFGHIFAKTPSRDVNLNLEVQQISASGYSKKSWSLKELEQFAQRNNPTIQAARYRLEALDGQWTQEGLGPNPQLAWVSSDLGKMSKAGKHGLAMSQDVVTRQKLSRAQNVVYQEIQVANQKLEAEKLKLQTDVRIAAFEYLTQLRKESLYKELVDLKRRAYRAADALCKSGETSVVDVLGLSVEAERAEVDLATAQNNVSAAWRELACVLGDADMPPVSLAVSLELIEMDNSWQTLCTTLKATSPEIAAAQEEIERARRRLDLEEAKNSPDFTLDGELTYSTDDHAWEGMVGISFPLRVRNRNQGNIASARSEIQVAEKEYELTVLKVQRRFADVYRNYQNAHKTAQRYRDQILPKTAQSLELCRSGYAEGELGYLDIINAQQQYTTTYMEYIDSLNSFWKSIAMLEGKLLSGCME